MEQIKVKIICRSLSLVLVPLIVWGQDMPNDGNDRIELRAIDQPIASSYCGMYALAGALTAIGKDYKPEIVFSGEFIPSRNGSSVANIVSAAEQFGATATPIRNLSVENLRRLESPAILHLNRSLATTNTYHWVLYLGDVNGKARILDAPNPIEMVEYTTLLAEWDNIGVLISDSPPHQFFVSFNSCMILAFCISSLLLVKQLGHYFVAWQIGVKSFMTRALAIVLLAGMGGTVIAFWGDAGLLQSNRAIGIVHSRYLRDNIPVVDWKELAGKLGDPRVQLIDTRPIGAFESGSIPGAINIPINASNSQFNRQIQNLPSDQSEIIVFCQSEACSWAGIVGKRLVATGFDSVKVFKSGVNGYHQHLKEGEMQ